MPYWLATASGTPAVRSNSRTGPSAARTNHPSGDNGKRWNSCSARQRSAGKVPAPSHPDTAGRASRPELGPIRWRLSSTRPKRDIGKYLHRRRVIGHGVAQGASTRARRPRRQIDEIDHDRAADPAQAQLPGDLAGCGEVGFQGLPAAAVDVDGGERRGRLDDQRAAAGERHGRLQRLLELLARRGSLRRARGRWPGARPCLAASRPASCAPARKLARSPTTMRSRSGAIRSSSRRCSGSSTLGRAPAGAPRPPRPRSAPIGPAAAPAPRPARHRSRPAPRTAQCHPGVGERGTPAPAARPLPGCARAVPIAPRRADAADGQRTRP